MMLPTVPLRFRGGVRNYAHFDFLWETNVSVCYFVNTEAAKAEYFVNCHYDSARIGAASFGSARSSNYEMVGVSRPEFPQ